MKQFLGIELGSTRIKSVLTDERGCVKASGSHTWENRLSGGLWTYSEDAIWHGLRDSFADLVKNNGGKPDITGMGVSAMMHGYIALDRNDNLLVPFRTWRNTNTGAAAEALTQAFGFNIPMRWSIAHLYQAILNDEPHVKDIAFITTLAGYVHYKITGKKVLGVGDASGMFPIDSATCDYNEEMLQKFSALVGDKYPWDIRDILPKVLPAGCEAGALNEFGRGMFGPVEHVCPPEGDAGTGMVATNSVKVRTGNVSAGTSVFAMVVMDKLPANLHTEIDMVTTPDGAPVAMVHCNNCTSDINAWAAFLTDFADLLGKKTSVGDLLTGLFNRSLQGDPDCGGIVTYNYFSGEPVTGLREGRPLLMRAPDGKMNVANLFKSLIYSSVASLALGMEILQAEGVGVDEMCGHGGFFKTPEVGQRAMSAAVGAPVTVLENAGEGGAWGIALLAAYLGRKESLAEYLAQVFADTKKETRAATAQDKKDFARYLKAYKKGLAVEQKAVEVL